MNAGGRIIQKKNITENTSEKFSATYKQHYIEIKLHSRPKGSNPEWDCKVWHFGGGIAVNTIEKRCTIHDALVFSLEKALL